MMGQMIARTAVRARRDGTLRPKGPGLSAASLPGALTETEHGPLHVVERYLEPGHCHGREPVRGALSIDSGALAKLALDPALEGLDPRRMLLFDTETTGLSGGTGTIPFLVGMAWFEDESLRIEQLFLRRPGEEAPMLHRLAERVRAASCLVTYNGKSFDWPLMRSRFVLSRVPMPEPPPHLDLLHCARRVYRRRMERVRLIDLETEVLGLRREDDVDGAEIPSIYLRYLRGAPDVDALASIIQHNESDLIALAAIAAKLAERFGRVWDDDDPRDHLGYAEVAARAGDAVRAQRFATAAAAGGGDAACTVRACMLKARLARRAADVAAEEDALLEAVRIAEDAVDRGEAHLALAKLYEHRRKDAARALEHAAHTAIIEGQEPQARRIARLERRRHRQAAQATMGLEGE
jgi:hypothetical protein